MSKVQDPASLVGQLTLEEKASLCLGSDFWHTAPVPRLGIPGGHVSDGPHGLRRQPDEGDHVGIGGSVPATCFPTAAALGSSWDPDLVRRVGEALGRECARAGRRGACSAPGSTSSAPRCAGATSSTSPRTRWSRACWARRSSGACRARASAPGQALRRQQPGDRPAAGQRGRRRAHAARDLPRRRSSGSSPQARPWTVMCAYNKVNGTYASQHRWLLTEVLRDEWGFDGLVVSDWGAVHDRVAALAAGLDLEMPPNLGVSDAAICRGRPGRPPRRGACSTRPCAGARARRARRGGREAAGTVRRRCPPRPRPRGGAEMRGAAEERRRRCCRCSPAPADASRSSASSPARRATRAPAAPRSTRPGSTSLSTSCAPAVPDGVEVALRRRASASTTDRDESARRRGGRAGRARERRGRLPRPAGRRRVRRVRPRPHRPARRTRPRCWPRSPR